MVLTVAWKPGRTSTTTIFTRDFVSISLTIPNEREAVELFQSINVLLPGADHVQLFNEKLTIL